jgi:hypothetical protein
MKLENREGNNARPEPRGSGNHFALPTWAEWWQSLKYVLLLFTLVMALALAGSFISYEQVVASGHPWLPRRQCPGCPLCGMTRSFCAVSSGRLREAFGWNRGGPVVYGFFWLWLLLAAGVVTHRLRATLGPRRFRIFQSAHGILSGLGI